MDRKKKGISAAGLLLCLMTCNGHALAATDADLSLIEAAGRGDVRIFNMVLGMGAHPDARDHGGNSAILMAAYYGQRNMVRRLIDLHVNVNGRGSIGYAPIGAAAMRSDPDIVRMLVDAGADLDVHDSTGATPLMNAIRFGRDENIRILLDGGASVNLHGTDVGLDETVTGITALMLAAKTGRLDYVDELLRRGADVGALDKQRCTALYYAILGKHDDVAMRLIAAGAPLAGLNNGYSLLHWARAMDRKSIVALMVKADAED